MKTRLHDVDHAKDVLGTLARAKQEVYSLRASCGLTDQQDAVARKAEDALVELETTLVRDVVTQYPGLKSVASSLGVG